VLSVEYILPAPVTTENIARMRANKRHIVRGRTVIVSAVDTAGSGAPAVLQEMVIPRNWAYLASVYQKRPEMRISGAPGKPVDAGGGARRRRRSGRPFSPGEGDLLDRHHSLFLLHARIPSPSIWTITSSPSTNGNAESPATVAGILKNRVRAGPWTIILPTPFRLIHSKLHGNLYIVIRCIMYYTK